MLVVIEKMNKEAVLEGEPLARGGEAQIYPIPGSPELLAKLYHRATPEHGDKLAAMIAAPPDDPMLSRGHVSIAWPTDRLLSADSERRCVGYVMRRVEKARRIMEFYNPRTRLQSCPQFHFGYLLRTARNLAAAFRAIHERGYVIGDVNESNILTTTQALVTLVDTDSFQVKVGDKVHRCTVGKLEYTSPELQGSRFADIDRSWEHDVFGLGVLVFQLLMQGTHPFAGVYTGAGEPASLGRRIAEGLWPYSRSPAVPFVPNPHAPPFDVMPTVVQELMRRCFEESYGRPSTRPDALTWQRALQEGEKQLASCRVNPQHVFQGELAACPWCDLTKRQKRDPFPVRSAVAKAVTAGAAGTSAEVLEVLPAEGPPIPPVPRSRVVEVTPIVLPENLSAVELLNTTGVVEAEDITDGGNKPRTRLKTERIEPDEPAPPLISGNFLAWAAAIVVALIVIAVVFILVLRNRNSGTQDEGPVLRGHNADVTSLSVSTDSRELLSADKGGSIRHWNVIREELIGTLSGHTGGVSSIVFHPRGEPRALSGGKDRLMRLWDLDRDKEVRSFSGHVGNVNGVAFHPDGDVAFSCSADGTLRVWDVGTAIERSRWTEPFRSGGVNVPLNCLAISRDGTKVACGNDANQVTLLDFDKDRRALTKRGDCFGHSSAVTAVAFSFDGRYIYSSSEDATARMWDTRTLLEVRKFTGHNDGIAALTVSPDDKRLVTASRDRTVRVWDTATAKQEQTYRQHAAAVLAVALSPDGQLVLSGGEDRLIRKWKL